MTEGELLQLTLLAVRTFQRTVSRCAKRKTAYLFSASAKLVRFLGGASGTNIGAT